MIAIPVMLALPDDVAALQAMVRSTRAELAAREAELRNRDLLIEKLRHQLALQRRQRYGVSCGVARPARTRVVSWIIPSAVSRIISTDWCEDFSQCSGIAGRFGGSQPSCGVFAGRTDNGTARRTQVYDPHRRGGSERRFRRRSSVEGNRNGEPAPVRLARHRR